MRQHIPLANLNSLGRLLRSLLWGVLVSCALWLLRRTILRAAAPKARRTPAPYPGAKPIRLQRDPVCGMHVAPEISLKAVRAGQTQHFCSAQCRDRYLQSEQRSASA
jgi:YHS domain-containing protein